MIISKIIGGLGNQMFQYAIAQSIAIERDEVFKIDISAFETYELFDFELNHFNIKPCIANKNEVAQLIGGNKLVKKIRTTLGITALYKERERTIFDDNVFNNNNIYLMGYWQNEQYFIKHRQLILSTFTPKTPLQHNAKNYLARIKSEQSVSLHIRRGDYLKHDEIGVLPLSYYQNAIDYHQKRDEHVVFFVFSNDIEWCRQSLNNIHNVVFVEGTSSPIEDLWLMSQCEHNIIANSTFSWWSAWLNQSSKKIVISPKNWRRINPNNYSWKCDDWIELE